MARSAELEVEPASLKDGARCACCSQVRRTAWGFVYALGEPHACYFVEWTLGRKACVAKIDVVVGAWQDGTTENDRCVVSFDYQAGSFELASPEGRPAAAVGRTVDLEKLAGSDEAREAQRIAGAVLDGDERLAALRHADQTPSGVLPSRS